MKLTSKSKFALASLAVGGFFLAAKPAFAQSEVADLKVAADTMWVLIAGFLVFFMNAGFAMLETGFNRSKNAVNILAKNFVVFGLAAISFWVLGFALMFGNGNDYLGFAGFLLRGADNSPAMYDAYRGVYSSLSWTGVPLEAKFFFQLAFAATAATIVSGAVAERIKFVSFIVFALILVGVFYPITGHWIWGGGWLQERGFWDFAGSTVVHSVGGWAALAGCLVLGPRLGKYKSDGAINSIPGHNMSIATLGTLILWFGWYGFNPGSTMAADPGAIAHIVVTTTMAASAGIVSATCISWLVLGKPDLSMIVNGCLAGLVAITAPCAFVGLTASALIGLIGGILVVFAVLAIDRIRIDDPVGALSVHLVNGVWGTLSLGLFAKDAVAPGTTGNGLFYGGGAGLLIAQIEGILAVGAFTFVASAALWLILKAVMGIRVSQEEEIEGLDIHEHGMEAYSGDTFSRGDMANFLAAERDRMLSS